MKKLFEKFKSWRNTRKNYRNAKIVLAVNLANITTTLSKTIDDVNKLVDDVNKLVETQKETVGEMTSDDFANLLRFTSAVRSPDFQKTVIDSVVNSIKDRDKEDHTYIEK